jgi:ribokinase
MMFVGHVSVDQVENPNGTRVQPGGAALYAAMAARTLLREITLVSAIGRDFGFMETLKEVGSKYIRVLNMPSTSFHINYDDRWKAQYKQVINGAGSRITASSVPFELLKSGDIVHLSPMRAVKVAKIMKRIKEVSPNTKVSVNTWTGYIKEGRKSREILLDLASEADFFILNEGEAKALTRTESISTALRLIKAKTLIVTLGEIGAIVGGEETETQIVPALRVPYKKVVDTTGAGDTWCGGFLVAYKLTGNMFKSMTVASILSSIKCSGWGFDRIKNLRFREPNDVIEYVIGLKEGRIQKRISDYTKKDSM